MNFHILTIFPGMIRGALAESILGKAVEKGLINLDLVDIRDFAGDKHRMVDDYPYGGGPGMVMKPEPIIEAAESLEVPPETPFILLTPQGRTFNHEMARDFSRTDDLVLICGRYEGVDERIMEKLPIREVSVGDFVLTGGEFASLIVIDAVSRLIPGVLGDDASPLDESFADGLLEYPQYTRPAEYRGLKVPEILLSGNHGRIEDWRRRQSIKRTLQKRPDLLEAADLDEKDRDLLDKLKK
ncbi:MAG: tRNA (guanosine(37)-N1)-methyltransferase TrmD [Deltaproteobacteria bacterium]|nr:tRNA (guanosine(37)-N1)-methyltransferase TrmD [Deltaproteobacteria bacterium]